MKKIISVCYLLLLLIFCAHTAFSQNPPNGRILLQGFWWDYWNDNFPYAYADYMTELAPRLHDLGIDLVWFPPTSKNDGTSSVGYSPFDPYDLGDKFQKGTTKTRFGTKDQYLRSVAVMHANGIGVIQDIVLNHRSNAGSAYGGAGGQDTNSTYSMVNESGYKTFRHVSYATPAPAASTESDQSAETEADYWSRSGRWSMNYTNFHPNMWTNTTSGDWAMGGWGPDISYEDGRSYGPASNITSGYNPLQDSGYVRTGARNWLIWLKKQTGVNGFRWDAVKHFPYYVVQDLSYNVKYLADWANGGVDMFNVGEWVGSAAQMDGYINDVQYSNGGTEDLIGTFDFSLREGLYYMISGDGHYNIGNIPNTQQTNRTRTVPFVNNHDTFRPNGFDADGNYSSWDTGSELAPHIDPDDCRIQAAYAIAMSVDGAPSIFFEDLFDLSTTARYSHLPTSETDLPVRDYLLNLIWCHQNLEFKNGSYLVRWQSGDVLVIERSGKALIGTTDNYSSGQWVTVDTDFGANVELHDYSGANSSNISTNAWGRANFWIPPCDGSNTRRGYCVWAPAGISGSYALTPSSTTQEWEMADDLGDSHALSLRQGGGLPANSKSLRTAGRIFAEAGSTITVDLYQERTVKKNVALALYNAAGTSLKQVVTGPSDLTLTYTPAISNYFTIKVRNNSLSNPAQKAWVKASYTAPQSVSTASYSKEHGGEISGEILDAVSFELEGNYPNPFNPSTTISFTLPSSEKVSIKVFDILGKEVATLVNGLMPGGYHSVKFNAEGLSGGIYFYRMTAGSFSSVKKCVLLK